MKAYRKKVKQKHLYMEHLNILNGMLGLTTKELEVMSLLLKIAIEQKSAFGTKVDILSTDNRKAIMHETRINKNNLSKYVALLKEKGVVMHDKDGYYINKMFLPESTEGTLETLFILEIEQDDEKNRTSNKVVTEEV